MKPGIDADLVMAVVDARPEGIKLEEKKGWWKLEGPQGHRMYIAKGKVCRQIDLSEFGEGLVGTVRRSKLNGNVEAHVDLADERALDHILMFMHLMLTLPRKEAPKKSALGGPARPKGFEVKVDVKSSPIADLKEDDKKAARLARIRAFAAEKGVEVSPTTLAALSSPAGDEAPAQASDDEPAAE